MKTILIFVFALSLSGCAGKAPIVSNTPVNERPERSQTAIAHTTENERQDLANSNTAALAQGKTKWTQGGDPIDTSGFDLAVSSAEKTLRSKPSDDAAKKELSQAYYRRAVALTESRQYAAAIGDYRRAVKYDSENADAKEWIDKIIMIYDSMNKQYPPEGQEPPPLPWKGETGKR
jgi:tetratricopeptide (TPR) repeat protein